MKDWIPLTLSLPLIERIDSVIANTDLGRGYFNCYFNYCL